MYFTTKSLVIALAAGAVAMPADTPHGDGPGALSKHKMGGKPPGGNSTKSAPAHKRDFLGLPFPNITDIISGIGARGEEGVKHPGPPPHGAKNATKLPPPGAKHVRRSWFGSEGGGSKLPSGKNMTMPEALKATKTRRQEEGGKEEEDEEGEEKEGGGGGGEDDEGGESEESSEAEEGGEEEKPKKPEGSEAAKPKKPEGSGAPKPEKPKGSGTPVAAAAAARDEGGKKGGKPKKPEGSGAPKPKGSGAPKPPKGSDAPVAAAGHKRSPTPPHAPKSNGTMPHPPGPAGKRKARGPVALRFWA
ncbi:hypothetical protein PG993_008298 [Apiospora rasikravindrae]|uniref:Uncharacterized protein n=1 Tax=Apiospora rasikravindrae TaxID=990691 RepID=A0ABR1SZY9_9PEZI